MNSYRISVKEWCEKTNAIGIQSRAGRYGGTLNYYQRTGKFQICRGYTAVRYLEKNPETKVILSGGQGPGENISEAEALRRLLLERKIDKERIFLEDKSKNTMENFKISNELYNLSDKNIIVVTSDYHMFRALSIAKKLKFTNVSGLPGRSQRSVLPAFLIREYVTIIYYKLLGRI